VSRTSAV